MAATGPQPPSNGPWTRPAMAIDDWLQYHKTVVSATTASLISTFAGFPLDSLKSRLQSSRESISIPRLAAEVIKEEGIGGLWRGFPLPLFTISIVRTISFTIYSSTKRILNSQSKSSSGSNESTQPDSRWSRLNLGLFAGDNSRDVAITSLLAGAVSGGVVCLGSAPFELVKVRRQLEYQIYRDSHPEVFAPMEPNTSRLAPPNASLKVFPVGTSSSPPIKPQPKFVSSVKPPPFIPPTTIQAVRMIVQSSGFWGLWTGFRLHFIRDTMGTALYFAEYDVMRFWLGRKKGGGNNGAINRDGKDYVQGDLPEWARYWLPASLVPFICGSVAGVTSWALIYPVDAIKTKAQQRALSGLEPRTPMVQLMRLVRGPDKNNPKPLLTGVARLYRGLGVSMIRSMLTHGLLWTFVDWASYWIDRRPVETFLTSSTMK